MCDNERKNIHAYVKYKNARGQNNAYYFYNHICNNLMFIKSPNQERADQEILLMLTNETEQIPSVYRNL
jgi:hypothetical protein